MRLRPITKNAIWGGTFLSERFSKAKKDSYVAESWELSIRQPSDISVIENGAYAGMPLSEIPFFADMKDNFPLLIKYLDANDDLSIQVHPSGEAARNSGEREKCELWYVLQAKPEARIVYGLKRHTDLAMLRHYINDGRLTDILNYEAVHTGDVFLIPPGMIHALGGGITVAEIQTNSNTTYRLYDYERRQKDGTLRPLHIDAAIQNACSYTKSQIDALRFSTVSPKLSGNVLAAAKEFSVVLHDSENIAAIAPIAPFTIVMCTSGNGVIESDCGSFPYKAGDTYLIPAQCGEIHLHGGTLLAVYPPM